jgi:membrane protein implicated in regulation of membrane protease activity
MRPARKKRKTFRTIAFKQTSQFADVSPRTATVAGMGLLLMAILAPFANFYALGNLVDSFGKILIPDYNFTVAMLTFVGEFLLIFWLLWKGIKGLDQRPVTRLLEA